MPFAPSPIRAGLPLLGVAALLVVVGFTPASGPSSVPPDGDAPARSMVDETRLTGPEPLPLTPSPEMDKTAADDGVVVVRGRGWGHSVGMSQYGAQAQALAGRSFTDILGYYYPGTTVEPHEAAEGGVRVGLFRNQRIEDQTELQLATSGRGGGAPTRPVEVEVDGATHPLPSGETWTLRALDEETVALVDAAGQQRAEGAPPARVRYSFLDGTPTQLRLPQLAEVGLGTLQWGRVDVGVGEDGDLQPTLVVPLELYLRGLAEMPSGWELEALKAQAVAGRTYAVRMVLDGRKDDCDCHLGTTPHDQAYAAWAKEGGQLGARWRAAVEQTAGRVATYEGDLAWTYYSSSHGGRTEAAPDSWAYDEEQDLPYLVSLDDPWSLDAGNGNPMRSWERELPAGAFARALGLVEVHEVTITERTDGGSPSELLVSGVDFAGNTVSYPFRGWKTGIAASDLKLFFRAELPSQQLTEIEVRSG